jgi:hypothetical protein
MALVYFMYGGQKDVLPQVPGSACLAELVGVLRSELYPKNHRDRKCHLKASLYRIRNQTKTRGALASSMARTGAVDDYSSQTTSTTTLLETLSAVAERWDAVSIECEMVIRR